jgi:hypothetical protein
MAKHQVLFCPFCRESFEDLESCPEHELRLVPLALLPADEHADESEQDELTVDRELAERLPALPEDRELALFAPQHGRALVAVGALLNALALALPLVRLEGAPMLTTFELARARPSLWTLALVSFTSLYALARRRSLRQLRGLRVLVPLLALVSPATLLAVLRPLAGRSELGMAVYVVAAAALLLGYGGARLGAPASAR